MKKTQSGNATPKNKKMKFRFLNSVVPFLGSRMASLILLRARWRIDRRRPIWMRMRKTSTLRRCSYCSCSDSVVTTKLHSSNVKLSVFLSACLPGGAVWGSEAQRGGSAAGEGGAVWGAETSPGDWGEHWNAGAGTPQDQREGQVQHVHRWDSWLSQYNHCFSTAPIGRRWSDFDFFWLCCVCRRPGEDSEPAAVSVQPAVKDRQISARSRERGADAGGHSRGEGETGHDRFYLSDSLFTCVPIYLPIRLYLVCTGLIIRL